MGLLKKSAPSVPDATEDRLQAIERDIKYRQYSPKAAAIVEDNDRRTAEHIRAMDERMDRLKVSEAQKADLLKRTTADLLKRGILGVAIDGKKITTNDGLKCPDCGSTINEFVIIVETMTKMWTGSGGNYNAMVIRDARSPLSAFMGMPFTVHGASCRSCGTSHRVMAQINVIE